MDYANANGGANGLYLIPVLLLFLALRTWLGGARQRNIRIERLWIIPAVFTVLVATGLARQPPPFTVAVVSALTAAFAIGFTLGWLRGRLTTITVEPETHTLKGQNSALGVILGRRVEVLLRSLRLLREAKAARAAGQAVPAEITDAG